MADAVFLTGQDLIDRTIKLIGEVPGAAVQEYTEDVLLEFLRLSFNLVFTKYPWERYTRWQTEALAGAAGKLSAVDPLGDVRNTEDIIAVYNEGSRDPLPMLPRRGNPFLITGTTPRYWTELPITDADFVKKRVQIWPLLATGNLNIGVRINPVIETTTKLYLDDNMLMYGMAWQILEDEGTNAAGADKYMKLFDQRWRDIQKALADHPVGEPNAPIPNQWFAP